MGRFNVKIFIACGSGIATSTLAADAVKKIAVQENIPVEIKKGSFAELATLDHSYELILTTANFQVPLDRPSMNIFGLVTKINKDKAREDLVGYLRTLYKG